MTNTTSASYDLMACEEFFSSVDSHVLFPDTLLSSLPCPRPLFLCIQDINALRRRLANDCGNLPPQYARTAAHAVFERIRGFRPETWGVGVPAMPTPDICAAVAAVFQRAVTLYGLMTLAAHVGIPFAARQRVAAVRAFMEAMRSTVVKIGHHFGLVWPVIVAGAALGGAPAELQKNINRILSIICEDVSTSDGALLGLQCLRRFWASGKTEWDECFSTWLATVP